MNSPLSFEDEIGDYDDRRIHTPRLGNVSTTDMYSLQVSPEVDPYSFSHQAKHIERENLTVSALQALKDFNKEDQNKLL